MIEAIYIQPTWQYCWINEYVFRIGRWRNHSGSELSSTTMLEF